MTTILQFFKDYVPVITGVLLLYIAIKKEYKISFTKVFSFMNSKWYEKFHKILGRIQQVNIMLVIMLSWAKTSSPNISSFFLCLLFAAYFGSVMYRALTVGYADIPQSKYHPLFRTCKYILAW